MQQGDVQVRLVVGSKGFLGDSVAQLGFIVPEGRSDPRSRDHDP
ncbi:hypothetical protein [Synechococcus sp. M16CYN]